MVSVYLSVEFEMVQRSILKDKFETKVHYKFDLIRYLNPFAILQRNVFED